VRVRRTRRDGRSRGCFLGDVALVFIDVDGTLVGSSGVVADAVWRAAERARAAGIRLAISSGRPGFGVTRELAARLDPDGWHCFQNGASVMRLPGGESRSTALPHAAHEVLVMRARGTGRVLELYADDDYVCERDTPRARAHAALLGIVFEPRPFESLRGTAVRAQWLLGHDETAEVLAEPHDGLELSPSTAPTMPDTRFVNLTAAGVTKASAARAVADAYGIPLERVMFVGDGWNDAAAMRIVGWPVAMGNAEPQALEVARKVVAHVDELGLVEALGVAMGGG